MLGLAERRKRAIKDKKYDEMVLSSKKIPATYRVHISLCVAVARVPARRHSRYRMYDFHVSDELASMDSEGVRAPDFEEHLRFVPFGMTSCFVQNASQL